MSFFNALLFPRSMRATGKKLFDDPTHPVNQCMIPLPYSALSRSLAVVCVEPFERLRTDRFILLYHGNAVNIYTCYDALLKPLADSTGCTIYSYDYAGYGKRAKEPIYHNESNMASEALDVADFVIRRNVGKKCILMGHSLGGYPAAYTAFVFHQRIHQLVLVAAFASVVQAKFDAHSWIYKSLLHAVDGYYTENYVEFLTSTIVTIVHGDKDEVIHPRNATILFKRCNSHHRNQKQLFLIKGGTHNNLFTSKHIQHIVQSLR